MPKFLLIKQETEYGQFFEDIDDIQTASSKIPEIRLSELSQEKIKLLYFHSFLSKIFHHSCYFVGTRA
jgi:hypothetical protein